MAQAQVSSYYYAHFANRGLLLLKSYCYARRDYRSSSKWQGVSNTLIGVAESALLSRIITVQ